MSDQSGSFRLQAALEAQVAAGAPGALARLESTHLSWSGAAGRLARGSARALRADDAFRAASVTKTVTAAVAMRLAQEGALNLDEPLSGQLPRELLDRWRTLDRLGDATPRQLLAHTSGLPDYFHDEAFTARVRDQPRRSWLPEQLVDQGTAHGAPQFSPGTGFSYSDTGYVVAGILIERVSDMPLHAVFRELVFNPLGMETTWLEGPEPDRVKEVAHHYANGVDMATITPTIDWAGGGLVTTTADLARFLRGLWSGRVLDPRGLAEMIRWTRDASFPPGAAVRYQRYGLGIGCVAVEGVTLIGHTGYVGAFAFYAPEHDAALAGTHNASEVDRWPLVGALCRELVGSGA